MDKTYDAQTFDILNAGGQIYRLKIGFFDFLCGAAART